MSGRSVGGSDLIGQNLSRVCATAEVVVWRDDAGVKLVKVATTAVDGIVATGVRVVVVVAEVVVGVDMRVGVMVVVGRKIDEFGVAIDDILALIDAVVGGGAGEEVSMVLGDEA